MTEPTSTTALATAWTGTAFPHTFRRHQREAIDAIGRAFADGAQRAWVVLPPGAGKTIVGLESARRLGQPIVAFGPNTAIQGQWVAQWRAFDPPLLEAGIDRDLSAPVTALTYQALASFDPDAEVDEEGREHVLPLRRRRERRTLLDQLHENGRALVESLRALGPVTLVLDECHHLIEVWGRLLAELLEDLPDAHVIGLTGTPPNLLNTDQAALVAELFGEPLYATSIPAVVREGHLAPFAELAWFTVPTPTEAQWLASQAERFAELTTDLLDQADAGPGFLAWLDARFTNRPAGDEPQAISWARLERDEPELAAAVLRFHHAGLIALPDGATVREEHRHDPSADDWVALLDDFLLTRLMPSEDPDDEAVVAAIRAALPGIGYHLTRRGVRRGRSPVDRVLARSEAKTTAAVEILAAEGASLGERLRALVLCDHERASATLPAGLRGVLDAEAGSARLMLDNLLGDPRTAGLEPVLVTGRVIAAEAATARELVAFVADRAPGVRLDPIAPDAIGIVEVTGSWQARRWVRLVTAFYEAGRSRVLVGTRGLLGEGWDAKGVNTLVDLTTATTATAVVQTRGRALRVDPTWPEKVGNIWTVVCVSEDHPGGTSDWGRFVRKHHGYFAVTDTGEIASGVGHVDPRLSPHAPPPAAEFDAENVMMLARAEHRDRVRELWRVGDGYRDQIVHTIRVRVAPSNRAETRPARGPLRPPALVPGPRGAWSAGAPFAPTRATPAARRPVNVALITASVFNAAGLVFTSHDAWWGAAQVVLLLVGFVVHAVIGVAAGRHQQLEAGRQLAALSAGPDVTTLAYTVADGLHAAGLSSAGASSVAATVDTGGTYRLALEGVDVETSRIFTTALDEVLSTIVAPRYVVPRYIVDAVHGDVELRAVGKTWLDGSPPPNAVVYHAVPTILGVNANRVRCFVQAWNSWVSGGDAVRGATPEGEGILVTHRGADPFDATTALRVAWS